MPQNATQNEQFKAYIDHFNDKHRVGLVFLRNGVMLLIPPGPESEQFYSCEKNDRMHMIGLFGNAKAASEQQTRIS